MTEESPNRRRGRGLLLGAIVLFLLLVGGAFAFYTIFVKVPTDLAHATAEGIKSVFNFTPRVSVNQTIIVEQNTPILEVATVSRGIHVDHTWSHTWLGSTKTIQVRGSFTAKAGFDLREPFTIDIRRNPLRVVATMPPPRLLSMELDSYSILRDESGWWNRVSGTDRESAFSNLNTVARTRATASGILEEARATAELRIREIVERNGAAVEFALPAPDPAPQE